MNELKKYSPREERANSITHLIGFLLVSLFFLLLYNKAQVHADRWLNASLIIMYLGVSASYLASCFYHSATAVGVKTHLRKFDHAAIYLNIAGCYTPYTLYLLRNEGAWGWSLSAVIWAAALIGIGLNFRKMKRNNHLKTFTYLAMGWVVVVALKPLYSVLSASGDIDVLWWLLAEAFFFTVGALLYAFAKREFMHAVWHLFVLLGTLSHFVSVYLMIG